MPTSTIVAAHMVGEEGGLFNNSPIVCVNLGTSFEFGVLIARQSNICCYV